MCTTVIIGIISLVSSQLGDPTSSI